MADSHVVKGGTYTCGDKGGTYTKPNPKFPSEPRCMACGAPLKKGGSRAADDD